VGGGGWVGGVVVGVFGVGGLGGGIHSSLIAWEERNQEEGGHKVTKQTDIRY